MGVPAGGTGECTPPGFNILLCFPPSPPPPPPIVPPVVAVSLDPHLQFAHGGRADLKGEHNTWYNMLSAKNTSVNVLFQHDDFHNPHRLVHGSKMSKLGMTMRTARTGTIVQVDINATADDKQRARVLSGGRTFILDHNSAPFKLENVMVVLRMKKMTALGGHGIALTVTNGKWEVKAWSKRFPNPAANPGKALLNVAMSPTYDADHDVVAPHGLIGQSYDGDDIAVDGATDDYTAHEVTTSAMAEGAIEGKAEEYKMDGPFSINFKYSRFDATAAKPRDVSKLTGKKKAGSAKGTVGALPDVE